MSIFVDYEKVVLENLLRDEFSPEELRRIFVEAELVSVEYTGCGYFLTAKHELFPSSRSVCSGDGPIGRANDVHCGFVAFLEHGDLLLDCHGLGTPEMPTTVREMPLEIGPV